MSSKCPYCGSIRTVCVKPMTLTYVCLACEKFFCKDKQPKQTVFERITVSPEALAPNLVFWEGGWTSRFIQFTSTNREEAIAATVAKLKGNSDV